MDNQDKKLILSAIITKKRDIIEKLDLSQSRRTKDMYRQALSDYSDIQDEILESFQPVEIEINHQTKKSEISLSRLDDLGNTGRQIVELAEESFKDALTHTGQLIIDSVSLLELSQEVGEFLTWDYKIQTPFAEIRLNKAKSFNSKEITIRPD